MLGVHRIWFVSAALLFGCSLVVWQGPLSAAESRDWADALSGQTTGKAEGASSHQHASSASGKPDSISAQTTASTTTAGPSIAPGSAGSPHRKTTTPAGHHGPHFPHANASAATSQSPVTNNDLNNPTPDDLSFLQRVLQPPPVVTATQSQAVASTKSTASSKAHRAHTHSKHQSSRRHRHKAHAGKNRSSRRRSSRRGASNSAFADLRQHGSQTNHGRSRFAEALATDEQPAGWITVSDQPLAELASAVATDNLQPAAHSSAAYVVQDDGSVSVSDAPGLLHHDSAPLSADDGEVWVSDGFGGQACLECEESTGLLGWGQGGLRSRLQQWIDASPSYGNLWVAYPRSQTLWVRTKYLYWETDGDDLPALVTTSTPGTADDNIGVLGLPTTQVLFGQQEVNDGPRHGGRIEFGIGQFEGLQFDFYALEEESVGFYDASTGTPFLARPFFNIELLQQDASILACPSCTVTGFPNINLQGSIHIETTSEVQSAGISWRRLMWMDTWAPFNTFVRLNFLAGYRYFELREGLAISDAIDFIGAPFTAGTRLSRLDIFNTRNEFHGGEIGWLATLQHNRWSVDLLARLAMGNMQQIVDIAGRRTFSNGTTATVTPAGFLTQTSNSGRFVHDEFALIPELGIDLGFQLTDRVKLTFGYSFVYVSQATRPGDNIDMTLNESTAGGMPSTAPTRPLFTGSDSDFWAAGGTAGIEWRW